MKSSAPAVPATPPVVTPAPGTSSDAPTRWLQAPSLAPRRPSASASEDTPPVYTKAVSTAYGEDWNCKAVSSEAEW
eukprot:4408954-Pyramimonas_sp.AAC.1